VHSSNVAANAAAVDAACLGAAAWIVARGGYASAEVVSREACASLGVGSPEALGVSAGAVPSLCHLWDIEAAVGTYTAAFLATHGVACLADLEDEVLAVLRSRCMLPLSTRARPPAAPAAGSAANGAAGVHSSSAAAEEIDIDDDSDGDAEPPTTYDFEAYGVGPLSRHPAVSCAFVGDAAPSQRLRYADIAPRLVSL